MKISIEPFGPEHAAAAAAFNERMRAARAPTAFLLPTQARPPLESGSVVIRHYVAVDDKGAVRGGMMCQEHPAVAGGRTERAINVQAPLSEGIIDRTWALVAPRLIQHALRQAPLVFAVGMGHPDAPLPRLLSAMGWTTRVVPFYFRLLRAARCLRHLAPLRNTRLRRLAADAAATSGVAALGARLAHHVAAEVERAAARFEVEPVRQWSGWANLVWEVFAPGLSFAVRRTDDVLPYFYPPDDRSPRAWVLRRNGGIEGWFGLSNAPMSGHPHFGDLNVATLTDCVGSSDAVRAAMVLAVEEARTQGADLLITNQQHGLLQESCATAGWRRGPSNFLIATSPALSRTFEDRTAYVTRRDGDGLVHLASHGEGGTRP